MCETLEKRFHQALHDIVILRNALIWLTPRISSKLFREKNEAARCHAGMCSFDECYNCQTKLAAIVALECTENFGQLKEDSGSEGE